MQHKNYITQDLRTHLSIATFLWDIHKECRRRSDVPQHLIKNYASILKNILQSLE